MSDVISKRVLEEVRLRSDIADIIGTYFSLQRNGSNYKALCPFHKEKTPSFHVNTQRQMFHCFGCGAGGDVFKFVMQHENVDFPTAIRMLAERAGIRLEFEHGAGDSAATSTKQQLYKLHADVAALYHRGLKESPAATAARAYLTGRGLDAAVVDDFLLGYAPPLWNMLTDWGAKKGYTIELLTQAGLILKSERQESSGRLYDRFRDRLVFPIRDEQGRVVAFSARAFETGPGIAKYVNSPETPLFRKSNILYALDRARHQIVETREAILCEGQIDVIRCHHAGFKTAVAAQGTAFTEDHARILRRYADAAMLVFDSDAAGCTAAIRTAGILIRAGMAVRIAALPDGEDPDSFIRKNGADAFSAILAKAVTAIEFQIRYLAANDNISSEAGIKRVTAAVLQSIAASSTAVQRDHLLHIAARELNLHPADLQQDLARLIRRPQRDSNATKDEEAGEVMTDTPIPAEELSLAECLLVMPEQSALVRTHLPLEMISNVLCRRFIDIVLELPAAGGDLMAALQPHDDEKRLLSSLAAKLCASPARTASTEFTSAENIQRLIMFIWRRELKSQRGAIERKLLDSTIVSSARIALENSKSQLTNDIKHLQRWDTATAVIEMHLASRSRDNA